MYKYLSFDTQGFHIVQGNAGLVVNFRGSTRASAFDDPDVIRQLKADYLAALSPFQVCSQCLIFTLHFTFRHPTWEYFNLFRHLESSFFDFLLI